MNITSKLFIAGMVIALAACGKTNQSDVDQAARERAAAVAEARRDAQPALDAADRDVAEAVQEGEEKIVETQVKVSEDINEAAEDQAKAHAQAAYDVAITAADGSLDVALKKCGMMQPADAKDACEQRAKAEHERAVAAAKAKLEWVEERTD